MEYYSAIRKKEILPLATTLMNLESTVLGEIYQTKKDKYCMTSFYVESEKAKIIHTESRLVVARGWGWKK